MADEKKIEELSAAEHELLEKVKQEWLDVMFGEWKPVDRKMCDEGIDYIYGLAGYDAPRKIYVCSPLAAQRMANRLVKMNDGGVVNDNINEALSSYLWFNLRDINDVIGKGVVIDVFNNTVHINDGDAAAKVGLRTVKLFM